jgi:hypothetical protein
MRIDALTVVLRPRSSWEAVELGTALTRRHARAVWMPWLAVTVPVFVAANALAVAFELPPVLAALFMWWLKPLFDRLPLFVLSRAVFGEVPSLRASLRGAFRGGGHAMLGYLTWRRLSPARALLMPVDVLEGGDPAQAGERRRVIGGTAYGIAALTLLVFLHFEFALTLGLAALVFLFVPEQYLMSSLQLTWQHLQDAPTWLGILENALVWTATSLLEPFAVGAGFGLYLNRRTEIEGWDIELAFRRLRERLLAASTALALAAMLLGAPGLVRAQDEATVSTPARRQAPSCKAPELDERPLQEIFGEDYRAADSFDRAVERVYAGPELKPRRRTTVWKPRKEDTDAPSDIPGWLASIGRFVATAGEMLLWALAGLLVLLLVFNVRRWWPWLRGMVGDPLVPPSAITEREATPAEPLPDDIAGAARRHWAAGRDREALAMVYRGAVEAMLATTGRVLPPGATEAQCLRAAAALPDAPRAAFSRVVRLWQYAAYAGRLPDDAAFAAMLDEAAAQFGWTR